MGSSGLDMADTSDLLGGLPPASLTTADEKTTSPSRVIQLVLRVVCGFEDVDDLCRREGISREQFQRWRELFARACEDWAQVNLPATAEGADADLRDLASMEPRAEA